LHASNGSRAAQHPAGLPLIATLRIGNGARRWMVQFRHCTNRADRRRHLGAVVVSGRAPALAAAAQCRRRRARRAKPLRSCWRGARDMAAPDPAGRRRALLVHGTSGGRTCSPNRSRPDRGRRL